MSVLGIFTQLHNSCWWLNMLVAYFTYIYVICKFVMDLAPFILFFIWLWLVCLNLLALSVVLIKWSLRCFDTIWVCLVVCIVGRPIFINSARKQEFPAKGYLQTPNSWSAIWFSKHELLDFYLMTIADYPILSSERIPKYWWSAILRLITFPINVWLFMTGMKVKNYWMNN